MNPSEVSERREVYPVETSAPEAPRLELSRAEEAAPEPVSLSVRSRNPSWLPLIYGLEFFIAVIAIISLWGEVGGDGDLDLMPWHIKLVCIVGLAWCSVRFTAAVVEQQRVWTARSASWFAGILLLCAFMGAITYYYHLHEPQDDDADDETTAAVNIDYPRIHTLGISRYHAGKRTWPSFPICILARSAVPAGDRVPAGSDGRDPGVRLRGTA